VLEALIFSRYNLVNVATLCSAIFYLHIWASFWFEARSLKRSDAPIVEDERRSVPRSEGRRLFYYVCFVLVTSLANIGVKMVLVQTKHGLWQRKS
jgi:dolichol kinase